MLGWTKSAYAETLSHAKDVAAKQMLDKVREVIVLNKDQIATASIKH